MSNRQSPLERARSAVQKKRERQSQRGTLVIGALLLIILALNVLWPDDHDRPLTTSAASTACSPSDAQCLGKKIAPLIQGSCSVAVEAQLRFEPEWTDGLLDTRFSRPTWYEPTNSLIFYGDHLIASNGFGARARQRYFCVVDASTGALIKAGVN